MLLTIIFDSRVGFYGTVVIALIAGGLRGNDYVFTLMNIIAGALSAYTVRDIKNRSQIFRSFLFILIGYVVSIVAFGLESFDSVEQMLVNSAFAASNALISPVLTYGLIIFFERIFKITTELTLLEMTDFNRPLLKELARTAPGTFTHSMTMGTLVENAAESIGANTILARVGAYYHDIGKTLEPNAFVENQMDNMNIHENLDPRKSAEVIINHVKRGIELAREHKLPDEIIDFIPMHHGTMVISFFYEKAKEEYSEENVDIDEFRYPGPKPNTKETALVMLADACESTIRSMSEPDPKKVENVVNNLLKMRIDDGQLDDSPITLRDIKKIKEAFLSILVGQHHKRIRYPKQEEMENNSEQK
jgi:putative nucleotidyltransferase with HDIG domain